MTKEQYRNRDHNPMSHFNKKRLRQDGKKEINEGLLNYDYDFETENLDFADRHIDAEEYLDFESGEFEGCNKWDDWE